jgi:hypothetical protein
MVKIATGKRYSVPCCLNYDLALKELFVLFLETNRHISFGIYHCCIGIE